MGEVLNAQLENVLRERRRRLNSLFLQARVAYPGLSGETFLEHLRETVVPIAEKAYEHDSTRIVVVLETLYQISLKLVAQGLMGPEARHREAGQAWRDLLCAHPAYLCEEPLLVAASTGNALIHIAAMDPTKAVMWRDAMLQLGTLSGSPRDWLDAGQVAAWRCGLAQYRNSALAVAGKLDPGLGSKAIGLSGPLPRDEYQAILDRLNRQPWVRPEEWLTGGPAGPELVLFAWTGGFAGFGGYFATPPVSCVQDGRIVLKDDSNAWHLEADCFGVSLMRAQSDTNGTVSAERGPLKITKDGTVETAHGRFAVKAAAGAASYAACDTTIVIVPADSHKVAVLGLRLPGSIP